MKQYLHTINLTKISEDQNTYLMAEIGRQEIIRAIARLKNSKETGPNDFSWNGIRRLGIYLVLY